MSIALLGALLAGVDALGACRGLSGARDLDAAAPDASEPDAPVDAAIDAPAIDAAPDGPPGVPDLQLVASAMDRAVVVEENIEPDSCAVQEQCVSGTGMRRLLRFRTETVNLGTGDLEVGSPPLPEHSDDRFEWSPCHKHHHFKGYALYELLDGDDVVLVGRKQAFCVADNKHIEVLGVPFPQFDCAEQGLSRGWADVYELDIDCQWLDVTGLPSGTYTLRITVNPEHKLPESDTTNNVFTKQVAL